MAEITKAIVNAGIPVMGHIGLTPQTISKLGGFKVQGKGAQEAEKLLKSALTLQEAGIFSIVLECVPEEVGRLITEKLSIPTIGIGVVGIATARSSSSTTRLGSSKSSCQSS